MFIFYLPWWVEYELLLTIIIVLGFIIIVIIFVEVKKDIRLKRYCRLNVKLVGLVGRYGQLFNPRESPNRLSNAETDRPKLWLSAENVWDDDEMLGRPTRESTDVRLSLHVFPGLHYGIGRYHPSTKTSGWIKHDASWSCFYFLTVCTSIHLLVYRFTGIHNAVELRELYLI